MTAGGATINAAWLVALALVGCDQAAPGQVAAAPGPDAAVVQDVADAGDVSAFDAHEIHVPPDVVVTADGVCPVNGPPGPNRTVVDAPKPAGCPPLEPVLSWSTPDGKPPQAPELQVELGTSHPETGAFVPYVDGQWAPIVHGVQGGIHVWAAVRTTLPEQKAVKATLTIAGQSFLACKQVATELTGTTLVRPDGAKPGTFTSASIAVPGEAIAFSSDQPGPYCGQWIVLEVEVRHPVTLQWGRASVLLRLYDAANL